MRGVVAGRNRRPRGRVVVRLENGERVIVSFGFTSKLGAIPHFSLPRGITCPGATEWCKKYCYAAKGRHLYSSVRKSRWNNYEISKREDFVEIMVRAIRKLSERLGVRVLRLHEEGDFYSVEYIKKWMRIAEKLPDIHFYTYTRSWRIPELRAALEELRKLPNFTIIASTDPYTGPAPAGWPEAGIEKCYNERAARCPHDLDKRITCDKCKLCVKGIVNVWFGVQ